MTAAAGPSQSDQVALLAPRLRPFLTSILLTAIGATLLYQFRVLVLVHYNPWVQFSYAGLLVLYLSTSPSRNECVVTVFLGVLLARFGGFTETFAYPLGPVLTTAAYAGVISFLVLVWRAPRDACARGMLFRCLALLGMGMGMDQLLALNARIAGWKLDPYLYSLDLRLLGFEPGFIVAASQFHAYLRSLELFVYYSLPLAIILVYATHLRRPGALPTNFLLIAVGNLLIGYVLYLFYPAAGPAYAFSGAFPVTMPAVPALQPQWIAAPANAMPSLHCSAALLIWWNSRHWRPGRYLAPVFLALTLLATIGLGEHYVIDLIVAVPYALFIQALATRYPSRMACLVIAFILWAGWLVSLRYAFSLVVDSVWLLRVLAIVTVALPLWLRGRLLRSVVSHPKIAERTPWPRTVVVGNPSAS